MAYAAVALGWLNAGPITLPASLVWAKRRNRIRCTQEPSVCSPWTRWSARTPGGGVGREYIYGAPSIFQSLFTAP